MSFSKDDLQWLKEHNAKYINGAYYFDRPPANVKVCDYEGCGEGNERFLCQMDVKGTTMYAEAKAPTMKMAIQMAINSCLLQASVISTFLPKNSGYNKTKGETEK